MSENRVSQRALKVLLSTQASLTMELDRLERNLERVRQRQRELDDLIEMQLTEAQDPPRAPVKLIRNALYDILSKNPGPMHARDLLAALESRGIEVMGKDRLNNVRSHLSHDPRIASVYRGYWDLVRHSKAEAA